MTEERKFTHKDELFGFAARNARGVFPPVTIRRWYAANGDFHRADLFVGGWRVGIYKTEAGVVRRARKEVKS